MGWTKSSRSGPNCDNCVEVLIDKENDQVLIRDDKVSQERGDEAPTLILTTSDWESLTAREKWDKELSNALAGAAFLHTLENGTVFAAVPNERGGQDWIKSDQPNVVLEFTPGEIYAWGEGARAHEFDLSLQIADGQTAANGIVTAVEGARS